MRPRAQQLETPVDLSSRYRELLRAILHEKRGTSRTSRGVAVVSTHPRAGVTYTCNALRELINKTVEPTPVYQPAPVKIFSSGSYGAVLDYESRPTSVAGTYIDASRIAVTLDMRELARPGNEFGAVIAKSLEPRVLRSPTPDSPSVYEALYTLSAEWDRGTNCRKESLEVVGSIFRLVLLDVPSIRESSDIRSVAPIVDGVVVVVEADKTSKKQLRRLTETIEDEGGTILGYLLNKRTYPIPEPIYKYLEGAGLT